MDEQTIHTEAVPYIYIYIYIYITQVSNPCTPRECSLYTHTHTHTHIYIYIYIYTPRALSTGGLFDGLLIRVLKWFGLLRAVNLHRYLWLCRCVRLSILILHVIQGLSLHSDRKKAKQTSSTRKLSQLFRDATSRIRPVLKDNRHSYIVERTTPFIENPLTAPVGRQFKHSAQYLTLPLSHVYNSNPSNPTRVPLAN